MTDTEPQRLHPASPLLGFIGQAPQQAAGMIALFVFAWNRGNGWGLAIFALGLAAIVGINLFFGWLRWRRFTYALQADELVIEHGLFSRTRRSIPLERVQDVSIEEGVLARMLGLARVRFETGGSESDEGVLDSVTLREAKRLRAAVRSGAGARTIAVEGEAAPEPEEEELLFRMSEGRLVFFGLLSFSLFWVAALFGLFQLLGDVTGFDWDDLIRWAEDSEAEIRARFTVDAGVTIAGVVLVLGVVSGLARTVVRDFRFRLTRIEGRFRRTAGLLRRSETVVAIRRIQLGLVRRGWLTGAMGWSSLVVQTLGGSNDASGRQRLAPFARDGEIRDLLDAAELPPFERMALRRVAPGHVVRALIGHAVVPGAVIVTAVILFPPAWPLLVVVPAQLLIAVLQRRYHRYALQPDSLQVARGVLSRQEWVVPCDRIQSVTLRQGLLQRLLGVATVQVDTAGASGLLRPHVHDTATEDAVDLAARLVARV